MPRRRTGRGGRGAGAGDEPRRPIKAGSATIYGPYRHTSGWQVTIRGPGGSRGRTYPTEADALRAIIDLATEARSAAPVELSTALDEYLEHLRGRGREESTVVDARNRLHPLVRLVDYVQELRGEHVLRWLAGDAREDASALARRADKKPQPALSAATRRGHLARLKDAVRYWKDRGWLLRDPTAAIEAGPPPKAGRHALTPAEARALAAHLVEDSRPRATALLLALWLGLRHGEILGARVRALDLAGDPPTWHVERATTKTDSGVRTLALPPLLAARLGPLVDKQPFDALVFRPEADRDGKVPDHRSRTWLRKALELACRDAKVSRVDVHGLRDTWAQLGRSHGAVIDAVSAALGHAEQSTTVRSYVSQAVNEAAHAADVIRMHAPGGSGNVRNRLRQDGTDDSSHA